MSFFSDTAFDESEFGSVSTDNALDLLNRNTMTTAGVLVGTSAGLASVALVASVLPAQALIAAGVSGGLIYAGDRQHKGLPVNPFQKADEKAASAPAPVAAEPAAA